MKDVWKSSYMVIGELFVDIIISNGACLMPLLCVANWVTSQLYLPMEEILFQEMELFG